MIPFVKRITAFFIAVILSLSLCNTATVFATGSISPPASSLQSGKMEVVGDLSAANTPMDSGEPEQKPMDSGEPEPSEGGGTNKLPKNTALPANGTLPEDGADWREAATIDQLETLLKDNVWLRAGGKIRVTADLEILADDSLIIWPKMPKDMPLEVDLGAHTLYVKGELKSFDNIKYIGEGGENGLIRIIEGGSANIHSAVFAVTKPGGYAIWQENKSILSYEPEAGSVGEIRLAEALEGSASTFEELMTLFNDKYWKATGGNITITGDLLVPAGEEQTIGWVGTEALATLNMGQHTLYVEGELTIYKNVKLIGAGGENGLLRVRTGGEVSAQSVSFIAQEGGYTIWQEEGSLLRCSLDEETVGKVHFAEMPVAVPFSVISPDTALPVAVVGEGQTPEEVLPATDSVRLYWRGVMEQGTHDEDKLIPVVWDLETYRAQLDAKERVLITGSYPESVAFQTPVCLVVFQNGNPATFLNGYGAESGDCPVAIIDVKLEQPELGCCFEWSQDGETWLPANFTTVPNDEALRFMVDFPGKEVPSYPYYLSAVVDYPDGSKGYSDVVVFTGANRACGSGGNRGGGIDITDPPNVLDPNPPDNSISDGDSDQDSESTEVSGGESDRSEADLVSGTKPTQPRQQDTIPPQKESPVIVQADPAVKAKPDLQSFSQITSETEGEAPISVQDNTEDGMPKPVDLVPSNPAEETPLAEAAPPQSDNEEGSPFAKAASIVAGSTAIAVVIGAAGVYHSESLRKQLWAVLKKLISIKK